MYKHCILFVSHSLDNFHVNFYALLTMPKSLQSSRHDVGLRVYLVTAALLSLASWEFAQQPNSVEQSS